MVLFSTQDSGGVADPPPSSQIPAPTPFAPLSDPFKNMCLASQGAVEPPAAPCRRAPVPLFSQATNNHHSNSNGSGDVPCSQMDCMLGTQDFITPADQFDLEYDPQGPAARQRSPARLSPNRFKRPRLKDSEDVAPSAGMRGVGGPSTTGGTPSLPHLLHSARPPFLAGGGGVQAPRRTIARISSPPCYRSMFNHDNENEQKTFAAWRAPRKASSSSSVATTAAPTPLFSRYRSDFKELGCLGQGSFSKVFKARHRIDGCIYAVKRSMKDVCADQLEFSQFLQEAQVMAHLPPHPHIVRYFTCWAESGSEGGERVYTQLELCDVTLETHVGLGGHTMNEPRLLEFTRQIASALKHVHAHGVAHMDVKPSNIYLNFSLSLSPSADGAQHDASASSSTSSPSEIVYKLGDFGQATGLLQGGEATVNEGDSRYLPLEVMNSDYSALDKADIFSLGATLYELVSQRELPASGKEYQALRDGTKVFLPTMSSFFSRLIEKMLLPNAEERPSAEKVLELVVKKINNATVS